MTLLLLIRHGANDWVHGRLAGWTPGVHLNDDGRSQAAATAARLATLPIDAIYTSPLDRTVETAQAIAGPRGMPLRLVEGLSGPEISERTGLTPGTVRVNLHRGMGLLRRALGIGVAREVET